LSYWYPKLKIIYSQQYVVQTVAALRENMKKICSLEIQLAAYYNLGRDIGTLSLSP